MFRILIGLILLSLSLQYWYVTIPLIIFIVILIFISNKKQNNTHKQPITIVKLDIPIITPEMFNTNNLPISTKTEAKKSFKRIIEKYCILNTYDMPLYLDQISQEIEDKSYELQDNVNFKRETIRQIKTSLKELKKEIKNSSQSDHEDINSEIEDMKMALIETEKYLQNGIKERDEFKRDKRNFIACKINILAHGEDWDVNKTDTKYFIYEDSSGAVTARHIINFKEGSEYIQGFCKTREDNRTFRKDRILEYASNLEELEVIHIKYNKVFS